MFRLKPACSRSQRTDTSLNVFHMGKVLPRWMRGSVVFCSSVPTVCTCNSHRLSEEWREPGHGALSALMMRQLEAIFQLGPALTLKHLWSPLPGLPVTRMDGDFCNVNQSFKSDMMALLSKCCNFTRSWLSSTES